MGNLVRLCLVAALVVGALAVRQSAPAVSSTDAAPPVEQALRVLANEPTDLKVEGDWSKFTLLSHAIDGEHLVVVGTVPGQGRSTRILTGVFFVDTDGTWSPTETTEHPSSKRHVADAYRLDAGRVAIAVWGIRPARNRVVIPTRNGPQVVEERGLVADPASGAGTVIVAVDGYQGEEAVVEEDA